MFIYCVTQLSKGSPIETRLFWYPVLFLMLTMATSHANQAIEKRPI